MNLVKIMLKLSFFSYFMLVYYYFNMPVCVFFKCNYCIVFITFHVKIHILTRKIQLINVGLLMKLTSKKALVQPQVQESNISNDLFKKNYK